MKTEKLEKQTLTWLVFSANVIVGATTRQMVLYHGLDAFNGYVAFGVCILMLTITSFISTCKSYSRKLFLLSLKLCL